MSLIHSLPTYMREEYGPVVEMIEKYVDNELIPLSDDVDKKKEILDPIKEKLIEFGLMGIYVPEKYGGAGMDYVAYSILIEELSRGCASTGVYVSAHNSLAIYPILEFGNEEQKEKYLPQMAAGQMVGCFCLSEPGAGSDAGSLTTKAELKGDHYEITGTKNFITNGKEADLAIVFAKTSNTPDYKGISAFIVETNDPGFSIIKLEDKLGIRGSSTAQIALDGVKVPKENLLLAEGKGFRVAMGTLDGGRIGIGSQAVGIAEAAYRYARNYSKERVQFGKPISSLQSIQNMLADMDTQINASRFLIYEASLRKQRKEFYSKLSAQAKLMASETCMNVTTKAIQVCGGIGYTKECPVERYFRDAKITEIYEGTSEIQRLVIASCLLKEGS